MTDTTNNASTGNVSELFGLKRKNSGKPTPEKTLHSDVAHAPVEAPVKKRQAVKTVATSAKTTPGNAGAKKGRGSGVVTPKPKDRISGRRKTVSIYTAQDNIQALKRLSQQEGLPYAAVILGAVDRFQDQLHATFAGRQQPVSSLFSSAYRPKPKVEEKASMSVYIDMADVEVLDRLAASMPGCRSRNDLLSTAISLAVADEHRHVVE